MSDDTGRAPVSVNRFKWERRLMEADLPLPTKGVALICATYASRPGQRVHPGEVNLARQCGIDVRNVRRHLAKLRASGYLTRVQTGSSTGRQRLADLYWLTLPSDAADEEHRIDASEQTGYQRSGTPDSSIRPTPHGNSPVQSQHSASLTLAHDKSRADTEQQAEDLREDITERLEAWATINYDAGLDPEDHRLIEKLVDEGRHPRMIENMVKKRIAEFESVWPSPHEVERDWAASADCPF